MKIFSGFFITVAMLIWMPGQVSAGGASSYHEVRCASGYSLQNSGGKYRCRKHTSNTYAYKTANCANILNNIPGIDWKLLHVGNLPNVNGWGCCSGGIAAAQSCNRIDNKTCPSGYAANYKAASNKKGQTCRKKVKKYSYKHPFIH